MPPEEEEEFSRLSSDDIEALKNWGAGGALPFADANETLKDAESVPPTPLSIQVKEIFREHCWDCHRLGNAKNGIKILNHDLLVMKRKVIVPGKPDDSILFPLLR